MHPRDAAGLRQAAHCGITPLATLPAYCQRFGKWCVTVLTHCETDMSENRDQSYFLACVRFGAARHSLLSERHTMNHRLLPIAACLAFPLMGMGGLALASTPGQPLGAVVGEATFVIGAASILQEDGSSRALDRGAAVRVGDRIETKAGGHVHLRFVDGGRLSVRPASRLHIESYSHSAQQPQLGAIKFRLDEGVVRSITGSWGEAARERFRLNTPVAAIGVKGTDFVVRSDMERTAASVYTGAITLTPLANNGCGASVGPCISGHEKLLSDDMKGQILEYSRRDATPLLVATDTVTRNARAGEITAARTEKSQTAALDDLRSEPTPVKSLTSEQKAVEVAVYTPPVAPVAPPPPPEPPVTVAPTPAPAPTPVPPPVVAEPTVPVLPPQVTQLAWSRQPWGSRGETDSFVVDYETALKSGWNRVVGNVSNVLFQSPDAQGKLPQEGIVNFRLANATAQFYKDSFTPIEAVAVQSGALQVDFGRSLFQTSLYMASKSVGAQSIQASGNVGATGQFVPTASNANVVGSLNANGTEAAYAFEKSVNQGSLSGVTLWGR